MALKQDRFAESAQSQVVVNGHVIRLSEPHHKAEVQRVVSLIDRKIAEDDWRPFSSKEEAAKHWEASLNRAKAPKSSKEFSKIRLAVLRAKGII